MKKILIYLWLLNSGFAVLAQNIKNNYKPGLSTYKDKLEANFLNPPQSSKPQTWWHWMNGHVSKEGITADLESMKRVGIGGAQAFHVSNSIPSGPVKYMSEEWRKLMTHSISEANRLGLEFRYHNTPGWSASGGIWITPELSMKKIVFSNIRFLAPHKLRSYWPSQRLYKDFTVILLHWLSLRLETR